MIDPESGQEILVSRPSKLGIALRRAGVWVLLLAIVVAALTYFVSRMQKKVYSATGDIFITEGANANAQDVPTVAQLVGSDEVLRGVAERLGLPMSVVRNDLVIAPANGLNIVDVTANADTPAQATDLVTAVYDSFQVINAALPASQQRQAYQAGVSPPAGPSEPTPSRNSGVGFVLAILVGVGIVWFREVRRPTAADTQLVAERLGVPMFADLHRSRLGENAGGAARSRAFTALSLDLDELAPKGTRVLCLAGVRPGDLAADLPMGLARAFASGGWRIILVDGDPRQAVTRKAGGLDRIGFSDLPGTEVDPGSTLIPTDVAGLSVAPYGRRGLDRSQPNLTEELHRILDHLTSMCDLVLVAVPDVSQDTAARLLAASCQGLVLTVAGSTPVATIESAVERLSLFRANVIGFVRDEPPRRRIPLPTRRLKPTAPTADAADATPTADGAASDRPAPRQGSVVPGLGTDRTAREPVSKVGDAPRW